MGCFPFPNLWLWNFTCEKLKLTSYSVIKQAYFCPFVQVHCKAGLKINAQMTTQISQICGDLDKIMFGKVSVVLENHSLVLMLERPHGYYHSNIYLTKKELFTAINIDCTVAHYVRWYRYTHNLEIRTHDHTLRIQKRTFMSAINVWKEKKSQELYEAKQFIKILFHSELFRK